MNYCDKEDLRFEVLKGISVHGTMEHEYELESTKEMLVSVEVNQRTIFVGIEQGIGKNDDNVLVVMHRGIMLQWK